MLDVLFKVDHTAFLRLQGNTNAVSSSKHYTRSTSTSAHVQPSRPLSPFSFHSWAIIPNRVVANNVWEKPSPNPSSHGLNFKQVLNLLSLDILGNGDERRCRVIENFGDRAQVFFGSASKGTLGKG
jgi:hypothetical protein